MYLKKKKETLYESWIESTSTADFNIHRKMYEGLDSVCIGSSS